MLILVSLLMFIVSSVFLVWFFLHNDQGQKEPRGAILAAAGFGVLAAFIAAWLEIFLSLNKLLTEPGAKLFGMAMCVGFIEECAKFVPMALFIKGKSYFNEHTDGIIYFGIAGLTFGFIENIIYLFSNDNLGGSQYTGIIRLIVLFFFHAASTGIVGYYFAKAKLHRQSALRPALALLTLAVVHGLYDFLFFYASALGARGATNENDSAVIVISLVGGLIISALLNTFLFLYYGRAKQWDASVGLAFDPKIQPSITAIANPPNI